MSQFKPLLSHKIDYETLTFPKLLSPKLDGIRSLGIGGQILSRTLKPIPNKRIQEILNNPILDGLDGEIICGPPNHPDAYRNTTTVAMSHDKPGGFVLHVFDDFTNPTDPFVRRYNRALSRVISLEDEIPELSIVPHILVNTIEHLERLEIEYLEEGYEGIMLRDPQGIYKFGRSTVRDGILGKRKRYSDSEARVLSVVELLHNDNEKLEDNLGHAKRSTHQENKRPAGTMGALNVRDVVTGVEFQIGTGFTDDDRKEIWDNQDDYIGQVLTYKFFAHGMKDKPRHPVFKYWRPDGA